MQSIKTEICFLGFLLILMSCAGNLQEKASISAPPPGPVVSPFAGWDVGGGGDAYAAEFKDIGRTVVRRLKGKAVNEVLGISVTSFEDTLEMLKVETTEAVLKKGDVPVDALNYPTELKIELSLVHWAVSLDFFEKRRLVIHEILGLMKKDDSRYQLTTQVLEVLGAHRIYFNNFQILGEVAKTLIEKMPWQSDEMLTEAECRGQFIKSRTLSIQRRRRT